MTVSSSTNRDDYSGNGSTVNFAVNFRFLANSHVKVILTSSTGVETVQVETTNYTLTGAGDASGGTLTMLVAPASGETLTILRNVPFTQETDYVENDAFPAESHEQALDKLTMIIQQQQEELDRALKLTESQQSSGLTIPTPVTNNLLRWDSNGNFVNVTEQLLGTVAEEDLVKEHGTVAIMKADLSLVSGRLVDTSGYTTSGDGGGARYLIQTLAEFGGTPDGFGDHMLDNGYVAVLLHNGTLDIMQFGAVRDFDPGTGLGTDNLPVLEAVRDYANALSKTVGSWASGEQEADGIRVTAPRGTFGLSDTMDWGTTSITLSFNGMMQTVFAAILGFTFGTPIFRLGSKTTQTLTRQMALEKCSFNCGEITGVMGFDFYGCRDGSYFKDVFITGFKNTAVYSDHAGELGGAFMSEGVLIENVHAISFTHNGGAIFDLGGCFETTILGGKALLNSTSRTSDCIGYRIGRTECRGVHLQGVSCGNYRGTGNKVGIAYEDARNCWDTECTFESIEGLSVEFGKTQTATQCMSDNARHYDPSAIGQVPYKFNLANTCLARRKDASGSSLSASFEAGSSNCHADLGTVNGNIASIKTNTVLFNGGSGNSAKGFSSVDVAFWGLSGTDLSAEEGANGFYESHDQFWSTFKFGTPNKLRFRNNTNSDMFVIDSGADSAELFQSNIKMASMRSTASGTPGILYTNGDGIVRIST